MARLQIGDVVHWPDASIDLGVVRNYHVHQWTTRHQFGRLVVHSQERLEVWWDDNIDLITRSGNLVDHDGSVVLVWKRGDEKCKIAYERCTGGL